MNERCSRATPRKNARKDRGSFIHLAPFYVGCIGEGLARRQVANRPGRMLTVSIAACCLIGGTLHAPSGAPIAQAQVTLRGQKSVSTTTRRASFSVDSAGRYALTVVAHGFATVTVNTGDVVDGSHFDVVLEPTDTPKLRTIGQVTANGGFTLNRNVIPEMDVSRSQMDALGYGQTLQALQEIPSVIVTRPDAGAPTTPAVVSLRGPDPSEAMVTLDGQLLNDGNTGDVDLSQFAVPAFNSVSVTEGLGPTDLEGSNTFGGAVNFVSLRPTLDDHLNLSTSVGSYGMSQSWINATGTIGKLGYAFAGDSYHQGGQVNENDWVVSRRTTCRSTAGRRPRRRRRTVRSSRISVRRYRRCSAW